MKIARILAGSIACIGIYWGLAQASDRAPHAPATIEKAAAPAAAAPAPSAPENSHDLSAADLGAWLDGLVNYGLKSGDIAGAEFSIVKDGAVLFQSGYGYADVDKRTPMDPERTMTRIGSTSKLFTWTAVMQLVEQGKLDLHRNVDDYLDFKVSPSGGPPITLLDLMNHKGGFEEGLKDVLALDPHQLESTERYLKEHPRPQLFKPGSVPAYSNYGCALAGYVVERVSGEPFAQYVDRHIFQPLGMQHSTFEQPLPDRFKDLSSRGYRSASQPPQPYELVMTAPAGSVATTAADMTRFMLAHLQDGHLGSFDLLKSETAQLMHTPSESAPAGFATMAHGFFHETHNGRTVIGHGGDTIYFHTEFDLLPKEGVGLFYSFNSRGRDQAVYGLRKAVLDQFLDRYFPNALVVPDTPALASAPADAQRIAGRYESSRRVEHGLLSLFYLLQQTVISAGADGTILAPKDFEPGDAQFKEVGPDLWREIGGNRQLALREIDGVKTVLGSDDPTSVLQAVPASKAAPLILTVLVVSVVVLLAALKLWLIAFFVRRHYGAKISMSADARRWRTMLRLAAAYDLMWLIGWIAVLAPVLSLQLDFYGQAHDSLIRTLQVAGLLVIALAAMGLYALTRIFKAGASWPSKVGNGLIAAALVGLVWIGVVGGLIGFRLNY